MTAMYIYICKAVWLPFLVLGDVWYMRTFIHCILRFLYDTFIVQQLMHLLYLSTCQITSQPHVMIEL